MSLSLYPKNLKPIIIIIHIPKKSLTIGRATLCYEKQQVLSMILFIQTEQIRQILSKKSVIKNGTMDIDRNLQLNKLIVRTNFK